MTISLAFRRFTEQKIFNPIKRDTTPFSKCQATFEYFSVYAIGMWKNHIHNKSIFSNKIFLNH